MAGTTSEMTAGQRLEALENERLSELGGPEENEEATRLRADIAQTRSEIGYTLNAIQEKLSPGALAEQAKTVVREATIGKVENMVQSAENTLVETSYSVKDTIRRHPLSAALAGIGLGWLLMKRRQEQREWRERSFAREGYPRGQEREGVTGTIRRAAGDVVHRVEDMAGRAQESVGEATHGAGETVKSLARDARDRGRRAETRVEDYYYENPLAVGAIALAAGTVVGLAVPITRKEERWMGKARDEVVGKLTDLAQDTMENVQRSAGV